MVEITKLYEGNVEDFSNLYDFFDKTCNKYPENNFSRDLTYNQLKTKVIQKASYLRSLGCHKGSVIAILGKNSDDWMASYLAAIACGAIALPLDYNLEEDVIVDMAAFVKTQVVFADSEYLKYKFPESMKALDIKQGFTSVDEAAIETAQSADDIATYLYTSGTTGKPKIVQLTHGNIYKTAVASSAHLQLFKKQKRTVLHLLPLYHVYGLVAAGFAPMHVGYTYIFQPSLKGPDIMQSLKENDINVFPAVPQLWELVCDGIIKKAKTTSMTKYRLLKFFLKNGYRLRSLGMGAVVDKVFKPIHEVLGQNIDFLVSGGAPLKAQYFRYYQSMGYVIVEGYGLTETSAPVFASEQDVKPYPGHVGKCFPGNEAEIRNTNKQGIGEIWVRGVSVMPGYLDNEEANSEVFDDQGWFNTGDLGFFDKKGNLHVSGRLKNLIVLDSGKNVYPEEIEAYYRGSEMIEEIAVFGKRIKGIETVYAVIYPSNISLSYEQLKSEIAKMSHNLPSYKVIGKFAVSREPLPKTSKRTIINSKVIAKLEAGVYEDSIGSKPIKIELKAVDAKEIEILNSLRNALDKKSLYIDENLADMGFDSLKTMDLIAHLENNLGISISDEQFFACNNLKELLQYLVSCPVATIQSREKDILEGEIENKPQGFFNPLLEILLLIIKPLFKLFWKFKIINKDNIKINNNILIANHTSYLDIVAILMSLKHSQRKNVYMIGKKELKFLSVIFPGLAVIYVDRHNNTFPALKAGADILRQGKSLLIFPEGTRTRSGKINEFKTGAAFLARGLNKKLLPITVKGAFDIYPPNKKLPRLFTKSKLSLVFSEELDPSQFVSQEELTSKAKNTITENL